jgi:hypothetical protein
VAERAPAPAIALTCMQARTNAMRACMDVTEMARLGGKARAKKLGRKKLSEQGRKAALARWKKRRKQAKSRND